MGVKIYTIEQYALFGCLGPNYFSWDHSQCTPDWRIRAADSEFGGLKNEENDQRYGIGRADNTYARG